MSHKTAMAVEYLDSIIHMADRTRKKLEQRARSGERDTPLAAELSRIDDAISSVHDEIDDLYGEE